MRIFLTGGSGYIGRATIAELVRRGHSVEALARSEQSAQAVTRAGAVDWPTWTCSTTRPHAPRR
jgi:uncharacterized protein YbjT (DUF2867 family)